MFKNNIKIDFKNRNPVDGVDDIFYKRWSPRSFKKTEIPENVLEVIFDAARWSPSCFNEQPWLFITSTGENDFNLFLDLLVEKNQAWARNASLLGFIFSKINFAQNDKENIWSDFDCGSAWMALNLQASMYGLFTHGMGGIKMDEVCKKLNVPEAQYKVICGFAMGVIDSPEKLPAEFAEGEIPTPRNPLVDMWKKGKF